MKYFVFSIDDGTIYDKKIIDIFNRYDIKATFNLNSGLQDFVWYKSDKPVRRLKLEEKKEIYQGHEIASHSLTHPYLIMCPDDVTYHEVKDDLDNLKQIFDQDIVSFAFPFEDFNEQKINFIAQIPPLIDIRISEIDASFKFIDKLNYYNQFFIISTHDFELCNANNILNYHFNETYIDDKISFDYKIKEGKSETKNAIYLLKMANIIE